MWALQRVKDPEEFDRLIRGDGDQPRRAAQVDDRQVQQEMSDFAAFFAATTG